MSALKSSPAFRRRMRGVGARAARVRLACFEGVQLRQEALQRKRAALPIGVIQGDCREGAQPIQQGDTISGVEHLPGDNAQQQPFEGGRVLRFFGEGVGHAVQALFDAGKALFNRHRRAGHLSVSGSSAARNSESRPEAKS